jgi:hypothetical protein
MLHETLFFIQEEYNSFVAIKTGAAPVYPLILGNIAQHESPAKNTESAGGIENSLVLSLVNIEEEHTMGTMKNFIRTGHSSQYTSPPLHLNLYLIFSANINDYGEALKQLTWVIRFFQAKDAFTRQNSPRLFEGVELLHFKLHPVNFEQAFSFWGAMGGKYIPSVLYKVRMITIDQKVIIEDVPPIKELEVEQKDIWINK